MEHGMADGDGGSIPDELLDDALVVSRAFVSLAARSLADSADEVTVAQFRALVVLAANGPQSVASFGRSLDLQPPAMSRMIDRLARRRLVERAPSARSRREVEVRLTDRGAALVRQVLARRRDDIAKLVSAIPHAKQAALHESFRLLAEASGEPSELRWAYNFSAD